MTAAKRMRNDALAIFRAALKAADPSHAVEQALRARKDLARYERVFVVGAGKAAGTMARAAERVLGRRVFAGSINVKDGDPARTRRIEMRACGHPTPDARGVDGTRRIVELCSQAGERDLVVFLVSGGASALTPFPTPPVTLRDKQATTKLLLACGASIDELNAVRKHLSMFKGGQLARVAAPARVLGLILSDVVGDKLDVIGSGPTAPDSSTFDTALSVLDRYALRGQVPKRVRERLEQGAVGSIAETPKPGDAVFERVENVIVGSNRTSLDAAERKAKELGYRTMILASTVEGETRDVGRMHAAIAREIATSGRPLRPPACVISGGETTVTLKGRGKGGRNQEFALAAAIDLAGLENALIFSAGTDGTDGPTDAAGAIADGETTARAKRDAAKALDENDSYEYFRGIEDLVITGPTGTNVMDLHLVMAR